MDRGILQDVERELSTAAVLSATVFEYLARQGVSDLVPSGFIGVRKPKGWGRFGQRVVQYSHPLSLRLINKFGLLPMTPEDPWVMENARAELGSDIGTDLIEKGTFDVDLGAGRFLTIDFDDNSDFRVTLHDLAGRVIGKERVYTSIEIATQDIWDYLPDKVQKKFLFRITPKF